MVEDNLLVSNTISQELVMKTFDLSMAEMMRFLQLYKDAVTEFQNEHSDSSMFLEYSVAICNNCKKFESLFQVGFDSKFLLQILSLIFYRQQKVAGLEV